MLQIHGMTVTVRDRWNKDKIDVRVPVLHGGDTVYMDTRVKEPHKNLTDLVELYESVLLLSFPAELSNFTYGWKVDRMSTPIKDTVIVLCDVLQGSRGIGGDSGILTTGVRRFYSDSFFRTHKYSEICSKIGFKDYKEKLNGTVIPLLKSLINLEDEEVAGSDYSGSHLRNILLKPFEDLSTALNGDERTSVYKGSVIGWVNDWSEGQYQKYKEAHPEEFDNFDDDDFDDYDTEYLEEDNDEE